MPISTKQKNFSCTPTWIELSTPTDQTTYSVDKTFIDLEPFPSIKYGLGDRPYLDENQTDLDKTIPDLDSTLEEGFVFLERELEEIENSLQNIENGINSLDYYFKVQYGILQKGLSSWKGLDNILQLIRAQLPDISSERWEGILDGLSSITSAVGLIKLTLPFTLVYQWIAVVRLENQLEAALNQMQIRAKTHQSAVNILKQNQVRMNILHITLRKRNASSQKKIRACFISCLKYCSSWLKILESPKFLFVATIKSGFNALKHFVTFIDQNKNLKIINDKIFKLAPMHVSDEATTQAFNDFLKDLNECEDLPSIEKKFKEKSINPALGFDNIETLKANLKDAKYQFRLLRSFQKQTKSLNPNLHTPELIEGLLSSEKKEHEICIKAAAEFIDDQIKAMDDISDFNELKNRLSMQSLFLSEIDSSIKTIEDWKQKIFDRVFRNKLVDAYAQSQESQAKMIQQALKIWIMDKNKLEAQSFELNKIEAFCYMITDILKGLISLPVIANLAILQTLLIPLLLEFSFAGAFFLSWIIPALIPTVIGCGILLVTCYFAFLNRPNQNNLEGIGLGIQRSLTESYYDIYDFFNLVNHWTVLICATAINGMCSLFFSDPRFFHYTLKHLEEEKKSISVERKASFKLLDNKSNILALKDLNLYVPLVDKNKPSEKDPFEIINKAFNACNPKVLPPKFVEFLKSDVGVILKKKIEKGTILKLGDDIETELKTHHLEVMSEQIKEFFCLSGENQVQFYQDQIWLKSWNEKVASN